MALKKASGHRTPEELLRERKGVPYRGRYFVSQAGPEALRRTRVVGAIGVALQWLLYITAFVQDGFVPRQMYVSLPYLVTVLPLLYMTWPAVLLLFSRAPYDQETGDDIRKFVTAAKVLPFLTGAACLCAAAALFFGHTELGRGDAVFSICSGVSCIVSVLLLFCRDAYRMRELEKDSEELRALLEKRRARTKK